MAKQSDEKKEGITVEQLENFGKSHRIEIFFCIIFILSSICSFFLFGPGWSIYAAGLGGIIAVWMPRHVGSLALATFHFCVAQHKVTKIVIAVFGLIVAIFLPPLVFLCIGAMAGRGFHRHAAESLKMKGSDKHRED
jgi:hypothetical protein